MAARSSAAEPINGVATTAMNGHAAPKVSDLDGKAPAPSDWANYFCTYAFLYHQASSKALPFVSRILYIALCITCPSGSASVP